MEATKRIHNKSTVAKDDYDDDGGGGLCVMYNLFGIVPLTNGCTSVVIIPM